MSNGTQRESGGSGILAKKGLWIGVGIGVFLIVAFAVPTPDTLIETLEEYGYAKKMMGWGIAWGALNGPYCGFVAAKSLGAPDILVGLIVSSIALANLFALWWGGVVARRPKRLGAWPPMRPGRDPRRGARRGSGCARRAE